MKILNIYFKNLNSVAGETRINFQKGALSKAGVFAIIGPNGSGKSTILDAISLAFYGETFRFQQDNEPIMTHETMESVAQVDFSLNNKTFRTRWQLHRTDNEFSSPRMDLLALDLKTETILEQTPTAVIAKITNMIGMDFHNFSRSISLAQGDFATFLNALDAERMEILETMNGTDIYAEHKQLLQDKYQQSETALASVNQELDLLQIMDAETLAASEADLVDFRQQVKVQKTELNAIKENSAWLTQLDSLSQNLDNLAQQKQKLQNQFQANQQQLDTIVDNASVLEFKPAIEQINRQQKQLRQTKHSLDESNSELLALKQQFGQLPAVDEALFAEYKNQSPIEQKQHLDEFKYQASQLKLALEAETKAEKNLQEQISKHQISFDEVGAWMEMHNSEQTLADIGVPKLKELRILTAKLASLEEIHEVLQQQAKINGQVLAKNSAETVNSQQKILALENKSKNSEQLLKDLSSDRDMAKVEFCILEQQERLAQFKAMYGLAKKSQETNNSGIFGFLRSTPVELIGIEDLESKADGLATEIVESQTLIKTLEQAIKNEILIRKLLPHRIDLIPDSPCQLCGALEHPFIINPPNENIDSKPLLIKQKSHLKSLMLEANKLQLQITNARKKDLSKQENQRQIQQNQAQWSLLANRLNVATADLTVENLDFMRQLIKQAEVELKDLQTLLTSYKTLYKQIAEFKQNILQETEIVDALQVKKITLDTETEQLPAQIITDEAELLACREEEASLRKEVLMQLNLLGESIPELEQEAGLLEIFTAKQQEYKLYENRYQHLSEVLAPFKPQQASLTTKINQLTQQLNQQTTALEQHKAMNLYLLIADKEVLQIEKQQQLQHQEQELQQFQQVLVKQLATTKYTAIKQLKTALQQQDEQPTFERQKTALQHQLDTLDTEYNTLAAQLAAEQAQALTDFSAEELMAQQRGLQEKINIAQAEIQHLVQKHHKQEQFRERFTVLTATRKQQLHAVTETQAAVLQSETDGLVFRRRVQLHLSTQLLTQTNKVLEKISGRYYVRQAPSNQGLALEIEDTLQNNSRRSPQSLSGGESFVISLGLALGLAEMAAAGNTIDSLFLDEGFGNLDAEALVMVVSALQNLHTHGKTVGVISHVEGVRKRIKTKIEMVKKPNGFSQLKKVS